MFKFCPSALTEVPVALTCDPAMEEANSREALDRYLETGDPSELTIPRDVSCAVIRPLGPDDQNDARDEAGTRPYLGDHVYARIKEDREAVAHETQAQELAEQGRKLLEALVAAHPEKRNSRKRDQKRARKEAEHKAIIQAAEDALIRAQRRRATLQNALTEEEALALVYRGRWNERHARAIVRRACLYVPILDQDTGEVVTRETFGADPLRFLDQVEPLELRRKLFGEIWFHALKMAGLSSLGKARYVARPGCEPTSARCTSGRVTTADDLLICTERGGSVVAPSAS